MSGGEVAPGDVANRLDGDQAPALRGPGVEFVGPDNGSIVAWSPVADEIARRAAAAAMPVKGPATEVVQEQKAP